ncbi:hypothetical protein RJ639_007583 [Escallonia herrerae]|uniref:Cytochrome P450 n=1 Tax=Escallonia herrerae TaxID=1293975 RepID=A0AA88VZX8_9ASTE|nr:hypothetical protein RJ639_007583 [Escallonia herrerae]
MGKVLELLVKCSEEGEACDLSTELTTMSSGIIARISMSMRCSESYNGSKKIRELPNEIRRLRALLVTFDTTVEGNMSQHREEREEDNGDRRRKDVMEILMENHEDETAEVKISRNNIKAFLLWTLAEIINHPYVFNKLREDITVVVASSRLVQESDILNLPYLQAIVNGSLRLHPNLPLIPRKCKDDRKIQGYDVLANSRTNLEYVPFGSGRRACPGAGLAQRVMHEMIGALVQCFDFKVKGWEKVDMKEGVATDKAQPLVCYPIMHTSPSKIITPV